MIRVEEAFLNEERERDNRRNRLVLCLGEQRWHLSREEAASLAADLTAALAGSTPETVEGAWRRQGGKAVLVRDDGSEIEVVGDLLPDVPQGARVRSTGRCTAAGRFYAFDVTTT
jgi:hypothetical protein